MGFLGFESPEENYARAKRDYVRKHGPIKNPKPIRRYGDGWYDPNIKYSVLQTRQTPPKAGGGPGLCLLMTLGMFALPSAVVALAVKGGRR